MFSSVVELRLIQLDFGETNAIHHLVEGEVEPYEREIVATAELLHLWPCALPFLQSLFEFVDFSFEIVGKGRETLVHLDSIGLGTSDGRHGVFYLIVKIILYGVLVAVFIEIIKFAAAVGDLSAQPCTCVLVSYLFGGDIATYILREVVHGLRTETSNHVGVKLDTGSGIRQHVGEQGDIVRQEIAKSPLDIAEGWSTYILSASQLLIAGRGIERRNLAKLLTAIFHCTATELRTYKV